MFKVGDIVITDSTGGIRPPCGTVGVVSHYGLHDGDRRTPIVIVQFERYPGCMYGTDDVTILTMPPSLDLEKIRKFKLGDLVTTLQEITMPSGKVLPAGTFIAVDSQPADDWIHVTSSPLFEIPRTWVKDYWDARVLPFESERTMAYCSIKTCRAENDLGVRICWRCGNCLRSGFQT